MAIEIRELIIKATVGGNTQTGTEEDTAGGETGDQQYEMIQACVEKVMEIIDKRNER